MLFVKETILFIIFFKLCGIYCVAPSDTELILVHVIFRHGERTTFNFYPSDPHRNQTFHPYGLSALTNNGKIMMFELGKILRENYGDFLGDDSYLQQKLMTRSTGTPRTIMSASLVLAGLFPPSQELIWNSNLMWQPLPVFNKPFEEEDLLDAAFCNLRNEILANLPNNSTIRNAYIKPHRKLLSYVQSNTGLNITDLRDLLQIYFILKAESDFGLQLPEWTKSIYPEPLQSTVSLVYEYMNADSIVMKIHAGYLLQKILNDTTAKVNNRLQRKMFLYSGHEATLANLLYSLKVFKPQHVPPYGSTIMFELHKHRQDYYIKIKYLQNPMTPTIQVIILPECDSFCPLERFMELTAELLPGVSFKEQCNIST